MKRKNNKKRFIKLKIIITMIILFLLSGIGVMAVTTKVNSINITLADGYEMTVLTSKTKVSEILKENNILVKKDERVTPNEDKDVTDGDTIKITNKSKQEIEVAKVSESGIETTLDELLQAYDTIVEKIEVEEEEIPFETVKKDITTGSGETKNKVIQEGENGLKKITYKVKYQNNTEIERNKLSEEVIREPVDKIVQVSSKVVATRERTSSRKSSNSSVGVFKVTAYCSCPLCCGKYASGYTSSGSRATAGRTVAASSRFSFGTKLLINGKQYVVEDRGSAIVGNRIDIYMDSHSQALAWGVKYLPVQVQK